MIQWKVPQKGPGKHDSWYAGFCLLVNNTNYVNFLIVDLFWTNIKWELWQCKHLFYLTDSLPVPLLQSVLGWN